MVGVVPSETRTIGDSVAAEADDEEIPEFVGRLPVVATLEEGGLISYRKSDGRFLHTLNTTAGFRRKLEQLGIEVEWTTSKV